MNTLALSTRRARAAAMVAAAAFTLAACGGGGGDSPAPSPPPPPPTETLFVPANAWTGAAPTGAQTLTADEFRRRQVAGELMLVTSATQDAQRSAQRAHVAAERAFLESQPDLSDAVRALLAQAAAAPDLEAGAVASLAGGRRVALNSLGTAIVNAAAAHRRARDPALALAAYELSHALLDDALKAQLPAPATLAGATLAQVRQAALQMEAALAALPDIDNTRLDPSAPPTPSTPSGAPNGRQRALAFSPGAGSDNDGTCAATGLARRYHFPLRNFVSPVKDQGERGLCWAFTAIAAVESREQVQLGTTPNLSEQFLANRVKLLWSPSDFVDGGSAAFALNTAEDLFQRLRAETAWTYNPAAGRPANAFDAGVSGTSASYTGACNGYTGTCSESAHQSEWACASLLGGALFCAHVNQSFPDAGVRGSRVLPVWASGQSWDVAILRTHLAAGRSLIATFPVYEGFMAAPATGIVSTYLRQRRDATGNLVDGSYGDHLAQIVGFVSNEQLSLPGGPPSEVGGGGYFILRNSWGCNAGDAGYYYVPADYVRDNFHSLEVLNIPPNRSARWNADQLAPGGTAGLSVALRNNAAASLRVRSELAAEILVNHPVANYVRLTASSDRDGLLFDGQWLVNAPVGGSLFANSLPVTFQTEGMRRVTLVARYGSQQVTTTNDVMVLNAAPTLAFETSGTPQQNENFVVNVVATDVNETDPSAMCNAMTWSVSAPDTLVSGSGCTRVIRFGAAGTRQVSVATQDREGLPAAATGSFNVAPPPVNPYPRINAFSVISRDVLLIENQPFGCIPRTVANNAVIDLRQFGCKPGIVGPDLSRFFGEVAVENPSGEALSYDWTYTDYYANGTPSPRSGTARTATPRVELNRFLYVGLDPVTTSTFRCTLDVRVNAPEASRSKTLRVWSGQCINVEVAPR